MGVISRALRFRVFQRDGFHCQYCGVRGTPENPLEVDHIDPRANGGQDVAANLITACFECNRGKLDTLLTSEQIAVLSNRPLLAVERRPVSTKRVIRKVIRHGSVRRILRREKPQRPLTIPVGTRFVSIAPDVINPRYICAICGMLNELEGDRCSCSRPKARAVIRCRECLDTEVDHEGDYCNSCEEHLFCRSCNEWLEEPGSDFCEPCRVEHEETERRIDLGLIVRCAWSGFEQDAGLDACKVCDHRFDAPPKPLWEAYSR